MKLLLITLFTTLLSLGAQAQESEIINNKDWFGQESAELCTAWTMAGKLSQEDVSESIELKVITPKAAKKMPTITLTISEAALPVELVEDLFTLTPKISRDKRWFFNKVTSVTSPEGVQLRALEYSSNPENIRRVSRDLIGLSKLPFEIRTETNRYKFSLSLRGSTKTVKAMVKDCASRRFRNNNPLTIENKELVAKIISERSESSDAWQDWTVSPLEKIKEIDLTIEKGDVLTEELSVLTSAPEYVAIKSNLNSTQQQYTNLVDTISRDQSLLGNYKDEKATKTSLLPRLIQEQSNLSDNLPGLESDYRTKKSIYRSGEAELEPFTERRDRAERLVGEASSNLSRLRSAKSAKEGKLSEVTESLNANKRRLKRTKDSISSTTDEKNRLQNANDSLRNSENRIRRDIENRNGHRFNSIDNEIAKKSQETTQAERRLNKLGRLANLSKRAQQKIQQLNKVQGQIDNAKNSEAQNATKIKQLRQRIKKNQALFDAKNCQNSGGPNPAVKKCQAKKKDLTAQFNALKCKDGSDRDGGLGVIKPGRRGAPVSVDDIKNKLKKCRQMKQKLKTAIQALKCKALDDSAGKVRQCRQEKQTLKQKIVRLKTELATLQNNGNQLEKLRQQRRQLKGDLQDIQQRVAGINGLDRFNEKSQFESCQATKGNNFCRASMRNFKQSIGNRQSRTSSRLNEIKREEQNLITIKRRMNNQFTTNYTDALRNGENEISRLRREISNLNDKAINYRNNVRRFRGDKSDLEDDISRLSRNVSDADSELSDKQSDYNSAVSARNRKKGELNLDAKLSSYRAARRTYNTAKERSDELPSLIVQTRNRLASLDNLIAEKTRVIAENQETEVVLDQKITRLKTEIAPFETVISSKQSEIRLNTSKLDQLTAEWVGFNRTL